MPDEPEYFQAFDQALSGLQQHQALAGLLTGLSGSGALELLRDAPSLEAFAGGAGMPVSLARPVMEALSLHGIVEKQGDGWALSPAWRALTADTAFSDLTDQLESGDLAAKLLRGVGSGDYWTMPSADRVLLARSVSPNPYADGLVKAFRAEIDTDPRASDLRRECRYLELGCGVAGRILTTLRAAPWITAVGVELSSDLAAEAERRAEDLGLSERFTAICADAATFRSDVSFDRAFWSQFFFPEPSRPGALAAMFSAVRPGGVVVSPVASEEPRAALWRILFASWGVPLRTAEELAAEFSAAGFVDVEILDRDSPRPTTIRAIRP